MEELKVIVHGVDISDKVLSFDLQHNLVVNYIGGHVASFNRGDINIIDKDGNDISAPIKRVNNGSV